MNRREFIRGLASLGAMPAMPLPASGAAVASASAEKMYFVGWYTARLNKSCSADMLVSELNVSRDVAQEIFGKLVRSNTVSAPNAFGVSATVDPLSTRYLHAAPVHQAAPAEVKQIDTDPFKISKGQKAEVQIAEEAESNPAQDAMPPSEDEAQEADADEDAPPPETQIPQT